MPDYDNTNRGVLFTNDRKDSERHPDYKGSVNVNGTEYWLIAWIKDGQRGKFMSLSVTPKDAAKTPEETANKSAAHGASMGDLDDEIPFAPMRD